MSASYKRFLLRGGVVVGATVVLVFLASRYFASDNEDIPYMMRLRQPYHATMPQVVDSEKLEPIDVNERLGQISDVSKVVVAVVACGCNSDKLDLISDTWRPDVTQVVFVLPADCSKKPSSPNSEIFQLPSKELSPSAQTIKTLEYLHEHHMKTYSWFVVVSSETYVNGQLLSSYLSKLNSEEAVYLGKPHVNSAKDDDRLKQVPHEEVCVGGAGVVLSRAAMHKLVPVIGSQNGTPITDISAFMKEHLTAHHPSDQQQSQGDLFREDFQQSYMNPDLLWSKNQYADLLTVYPAILPEHMFTLHLLYRTLEYEQLRNRITTVGDSLNHLHSKLGQTINPKHMIRPHNYYNAPEIDGKNLAHHNLPAYTLFEGDFFHEDHSVEPRRPLGFETVEYSKEIELLTPKIEEAASNQHGSWLKLKEIQYYYVLRHGLKGYRYVIDAIFHPPGKSSERVGLRVDLLRPLSKEIIVKPSKSDDSETVNFVIPVGNVVDRFLAFLETYENEMLFHRENVHLIVVVYGEKDTNTVKQKISVLAAKYPSFKYTVVEGGAGYSRSRAFEKGMAKLKKDDLAFLCDVDLNVRRIFLQRCRRSAVQGKMVYFPEMFKLYNMKYVYWDSVLKIGSRNPGINRKHGFWEYYSYGMACMYKSDYSTMDQSLMGWGGEDVDFITKTLKKKLEVFRAPDTSLIHRWHSNPCKTRNKDSHWHCIYSTMRTYGDRIQLAKYVLHLEEELRKKRGS